MSKEQVLCMLGGVGESSYANNSIMQRLIIRKVKPLLEENIIAVCCKCDTSSEFLTIADLGCSSGPNALAVLQSVIDIAIATSRSSGLKTPRFNVFLNDLHHNDFNTIFKTLPSFKREMEEKNGVEIECFISGTPGSFYGRLFTPNLMHLINSFSCLQWLSQVPKELMGKECVNKGCIYGRKGSPPNILKAYREQFAEDFHMFLRCRAKEIVEGGRMLLSIVATRDDEACPVLESTSTALYKLASQGRIDKEMLDEFNVAHYRPAIEQVKDSIESEGSFALHKLDTFTLPWIATMGAEHGTHKIAETITRSIRAITQPLLASEFGEEIMDDVFQLVRAMVMDNIATGQEMECFVVAVSLVREA